MDSEIELFPAEKKTIRFEEPAELIFFDTDEDPEEAEFIRVDDLFREEGEPSRKLSGPVFLTLFPRKNGTYIGSRLARIIRRTLILSAAQLEKSLAKIRVRPLFVQWQIDLAEEDTEQLIRAFRADLEEQIRNLQGPGEDERFWSDSCFLFPAGKEIADDEILRIAAKYQN